MGCRRSPFLNMGTTLAVVQSIGIVPCFNEAWKNSVNMGVRHNLWVIPTASLVHGVAGPLPGTGHTCITRQPAIEFQLCLLAWTLSMPADTAETQSQADG